MTTEAEIHLLSNSQGSVWGVWPPADNTCCGSGLAAADSCELGFPAVSDTSAADSKTSAPRAPL